jgi:hypothetical protein
VRRWLAAALWLAAPAAYACDLPADIAGASRIETSTLVLAYRPVPAPIAVGRHFAVDAAVCAKRGPLPHALRVDAQMPAHRHGMNYRAKVIPQGPGRWRAEGLMFHMPGQWQFVFDVEAGERRERLTADVAVE